MEPTPYSVRSAAGRGSCPALDEQMYVEVVNAFATTIIAALVALIT
jgi:hypothetical protein